jgi:hypothetical protein
MRWFASRFACVSTTPFAVPADPEVYCSDCAIRLRLADITLPGRSSGETIVSRIANLRIVSRAASELATANVAPESAAVEESRSKERPARTGNAGTAIHSAQSAGEESLNVFNAGRKQNQNPLTHGFHTPQRT